LAAHLAVATSANSLLRLVRRLPDEHVDSAPRVLGIDDFATRKGHVYATILLDMETGERVDVLPDRTAETLAAWLREHPGAQIVCRDRAGAYANPRELHQTGEKSQVTRSMWCRDEPPEALILAV
jgi:transposase